ncbi:MAG: hypothetical protein QXO15_08630 [Nitrososphaerota archaeon]
MPLLLQGWRVLRSRELIIEYGTLILTLIECIGAERKKGNGGLVSYSRPYYSLRERRIKLGFKRFKKIVRLAEAAGLLLVLQDIPDFGGTPSRKRRERGRSAKRFLVLTEKGEKLYNLLEGGCTYGQNCELDWIFERIRSLFKESGSYLRGGSRR